MSASGKVGAFFDLDNTLIRGATLLIAAPILQANGFISRTTLVRAGIGAKVFEHLGATEARVEKVKAIALDIVSGWDQEMLLRLMQETLEEMYRPRIHSEALARVKDHHEKGHVVAVVSSSPIELVRPISKMFGIQNVIATEVKLDEQRKYTREFEQWVSGRAKPGAVRSFSERHGIDLTQSYGYSDSRTDIGFLEVVGNPIAVNPDRKLAAYAREKNWETLMCADPRRDANVPVRNDPNPWLIAGAGVAGVAGITAAGVASFAITRRVLSEPSR